MIAALLFYAGLGLVSGQVQPMPIGSDPRLRSVEYRADQVVTVRVATGYQLAIEFAPDETIESIAVGDSAAWLVTPNRRGTHLFVKPTSGEIATNMTVITDTRIYLFDLEPMASPSPDMAYTLRFTFARGDVDTAVTARAPVLNGQYRLSGDRRLRPTAMGDDGTQTFIEWADGVALPAIFALDDRGQERIVNGMMRDGLYVIDGVSERLVFRVDNRVARARRQREARP